MLPIGIMSIPRAQTPHPKLKFDRLMGSAGFNTGNLLFTNAVWQQFRGDKKRLGFQFDPEKVNSSLSKLVIPAANWLGAHVDFTELSGLIEQLDIPVILIGLGAQDDTLSGDLEIPDGTLRFVRAISERSQSISVRGEYTKSVLERYNIRNVVVTGCPSLYQNFQPDAETKLLAASKFGNKPALLHSTRYSAGDRPSIENPSIHRELFRFAYRSERDLLLQSEPEEISLITDCAEKPEIDDTLKSNIVELYHATDWSRVESYIHRHTRVFFDTKPWSEAMKSYGFCFGTRLHGTIMALNSGVPAVLVTHDSRTEELADYAQIPSIRARKAKVNEHSIKSYAQAADLEGYVNTRRKQSELYTEFIRNNGLEPELGKDALSRMS